MPGQNYQVLFQCVKTKKLVYPLLEGLVYPLLEGLVVLEKDTSEFASTARRPLPLLRG